MAEKRPRGTPTFLTPTQSCKRTPGRFLHVSQQAKRRLRMPTRSEATTAESVDENTAGTECTFSRSKHDSWSVAEVKSLVEFVLHHCKGSEWPAHHRMEFWNSAALYIKESASTSHQRSDSSCRYKVVKWLKKKFDSPKAAEAFYFSTSVSVGVQTSFPRTSVAVQAGNSRANLVDVGVQTEQCSVRDMGLQVCLLPMEEFECDLHAMSIAFSKYCKQKLKVEVGEDFLEVSASAMIKLKAENRSNVVYNLAKGVGTNRLNELKSRFPVTRMPMGLVEYTTNFFVADDINSVPHCSADYRSWLQTMYCNFGQKWAKLHHGPMWSVASFFHTSHEHERHTMKALVNVPSPSESTLRRDIAASKITLDAHIQVSVLDEAARIHPNTWWWIKADGADLVSGLGESVAGVWSGDVDLANDALIKTRESHQKRIDFIGEIGKNRQDLLEIADDLSVTEQAIVLDTDFVSTKLAKTSRSYSEKQKEGKSSEKIMLQLAWEVQELGELNENGRKIIVECGNMNAKLLQPNYNRITDNFARQLSSLQQKILTFIKQVVKYKRTPATHILVILISPEERNSKPYSLPIQCLAYTSLGDMAVRKICDEVVKEMTSRGMKVAGFATNGEWNSLRSKGYERPLSIFEIRSSVRSKYRALTLKKLLEMITPISLPDGSIKCLSRSSIVSLDVLKEVSSWLSEDCSMEDVVVRLRQQTVPSGYSYHTWIQGKEEDTADKLRSILAQFEFTSKIKQFVTDGVPFDKHLHIPEIHPLTGVEFCQREDEGHLFKRIANSLRQGRVDNVGLEKFVEALQDPTTGLTHPALTGIRKQSVQDVERLFGPGVIAFMERNNYEPEANYLSAVRNWRRAIDERGLDETQRQQFLQDFKEYICEDLMPWYAGGQKDFSLLEINRPIDRVRGFTRETLIGIAASIETREWRYHFNAAYNLPLEHPRSSTTDDVECFFSVLRDCVGKDFTLKQVYYEWRKICLEFSKRMDKELPFYYFTSNQRFYEEEMPSFNEPRSRPKGDRAPRRELLAGNVGRRASFPVRSSLSVRTQFHNIPVNLPPTPAATIHQKLLSEHSYA